MLGKSPFREKRLRKRHSNEQKVVGSNPTRGFFYILYNDVEEIVRIGEVEVKVTFAERYSEIEKTVKRMVRIHQS